MGIIVKEQTLSVALFLMGLDIFYFDQMCVDSPQNKYDRYQRISFLIHAVDFRIEEKKYVFIQVKSIMNNKITHHQFYIKLINQYNKQMNEDLNKYKFDNLQPITFLRKFNKMVDEDKKNPIKQTKSQLKVHSFTKFPLPPFYYKMEGIFQTGTKKKDIMNFNAKTKDDMQDEEFLAKHRKFMTKAIEKIIHQNQNHQKALENYKIQYDTNRKVDPLPKRSQSQPKIKINSKMKSISLINQSQKQYNTNIHKSIGESTNQQGPEEIKKTYLQRIQMQRIQSLRNVKKQKISIRDTSKISEFLQSRKNFISSAATRDQKNQLNQLKTARSIQYNNMTAEDWKKSFIQSLLDLQKEQNGYKQKYSEKVETQIKKFNQIINKSVEKTKSEKFW